MTRPDDALFRVRLGVFTILRYLIPIVILVGLLVTPAAIFGESAMWVGSLLFFAGAFVLWSMRGMTMYPPETMGIEHRVDEDTFDGPRKYCAECGETTTQGLRRRYARQIVALGVPLSTLEWGVNDYCLECAEVGGGPAVDPDSPHGHVRTNDESAARELEQAFEEK